MLYLIWGTWVSEFRIKIQEHVFCSSGVWGHGPHIHQERVSSAPSKKDYFSSGKQLKKFSYEEIIFFISDERFHLVHLRCTLIMDGKVKAISSPMLHFMCMYRRSCSAGSHLPWSCISPKTVLVHDKVNAVELCLPRAQMLLRLIVMLIELSSYLCTRETQCSTREVVINVDSKEAWQSTIEQDMCWRQSKFIAY